MGTRDAADRHGMVGHGPVGRAEPIYLEIARRRTFAAAIDWPGWCRSGRDPDRAIAALVAFGPRYATVVGRAGMVAGRFAVPGDARALEIAERLSGGGGTEFGAPSEIPEADARPVDVPELERLVALLSAAWATFDDAVRRHADVPLRTGPRGGGRQVASIVDHVREADAAYLRLLGSRPPASGADPVTDGDASAEGDRLRRLGGDPVRARAIAALSARARGEAPPDPGRSPRRWPPRYYVRRAAWHALDHAWEIEDRADPG